MAGSWFDNNGSLIAAGRYRDKHTPIEIIDVYGKERKGYISKLSGDDLLFDDINGAYTQDLIELDDIVAVKPIE